MNISKQNSNSSIAIWAMSRMKQHEAEESQQAAGILDDMLVLLAMMDQKSRDASS